MKNLKLVLLMVLAGVLAAQFTVAQQGMAQSGAGGASKQQVAAKLEKLATALQLTPAQKKQMLPILMEEAPQLEALKSNTSLGPLQKAMRLKEMSSTTDAKVQPILNPEQQQKWQAMREEERQQMIQKLESR